MKSVVNDTDGIVRVAESVIPEIKHQDEVRVKIASSGLCGSDLPRIFKNGAHYYPITLGHEFSGYIDAVGSGVDDLHPGDAVACVGNDSNLLIVFYVQIMPDDLVMQLHRF